MPTKFKFALIAEGITDQIIIHNILIGFFRDPDIDPRILQPIVAKGKNATEESQGGWFNVIKYCESSRLKNALDNNDYVIIHIDSDASEQKYFDVSHRDKDGNKFTIEQLQANIENRLIDSIGDPFYQKYKDRIIFAICVHQIECWLLPLYNNYRFNSQTDKCLDSLNAALAKMDEERIEKNKKNIDRYDAISQAYNKYKMLMKLYKTNPSLKIFIERLQFLFPQN